MRRLASQPRKVRTVRYGITQRMRAQHQTQMTVHVRKSNHGMKQQSIKASKTTKAGPGAEFQKEFKKFQFKLNLNLKLNLN